MAAQPEARIVASCLNYLYTVGGWWKKIHGGLYQAAGIPDILGCLDGQFFGIEVKTPKKYRRTGRGLTARQRMEIIDIIKAGGKVKVVCSVEQLQNWRALTIRAVDGKIPLEERQYDEAQATRDIADLWPL